MNFFKNFLTILFPSHCVHCHEVVSTKALFCSDCWPKLQFITEPKCKICSYPFDVEIKSMAPICSKCLIKKPAFDKAITIFRYNYILRKIVGDLKYRDQTFLAKKIAQILFDRHQKEIADFDLIVAVPLHLKKLQKRKFNQVILIAKSLEKLCKKSSQLKFIPDLLWRVIDTIPQVNLRKNKREGNLKKAFLVNKKYRDFLSDKKILLLDDVMTTGATLSNCAKALKKRRAKEVTALTLAKTIFD